MGANGEFDVLVIGAGFAGLGVAAAVRAHGMENFVVFEQGADVGAFWRGNYDRIQLHTPWHDLPGDGGLRRRYGMYLRRDELLDYFQSYAALHRLSPHFRFGRRVTRVKREGAGWTVESDGLSSRCRLLAVATSANRVPNAPKLPGAEGFAGTLMHSRQYRNAAPYRGKRALVVGSGNSAVEIALDLAENGAAEISLWVRAPRHFLPLQAMTRLARVLRLLRLDFTERSMAKGHRLTKVNPRFRIALRRKDAFLARYSQDLSAYGIRKPTDGPLTETLLKSRVSVYDQGAIPLIHSGRIRVIDGVRRPILGLTRTGVQFPDGEEVFDAVFLGTGFKPGLDEFLEEHERLLAIDPERDQLLPVTDGRCRSTVEPTAFFPGFDISLLGGLGLGRWGWEVGERMAAELAGERR